jgi:hypothetical protein
MRPSPAVPGTARSCNCRHRLGSGKFSALPSRALPSRRRLGLARQPQEHRGRVGGALGRMAATVLEMAALAGAGVEQRPEPVGRLRRRRRRHPQLAEQPVAELEGAFLLEGDVGRGLRERVLVDPLARGAGAALHRLELFRPWRSPSAGAVTARRGRDLRRGRRAWDPAGCRQNRIGGHAGAQAAAAGRRRARRFPSALRNEVPPCGRSLSGHAARRVFRSRRMSAWPIRPRWPVPR